MSSAELAQDLPFSETPGTAPWETPKERLASIRQEIQARDPQKNHGRCQKESRKSGQESLGVEIVENPVKWDGLVDAALLRPVPERGGDDARNAAASYLMCKTSSTRPVLNFIGPVISIWDLAPI